MSKLRTNRWETLDGEAAGALYADTVLDMESITASYLTDGQLVVVAGSVFSWDGTAFMPLGNVSVKSFGAVGDGIADDSAAIIEAINYVDSLPDSRKVSVYFPGGTYRTTQAINLKNVSIIGDGFRNTVIAPELTAGQTTNGCFYSSVSLDFFRAERLFFDLSSVDGGNSAIDCTKGAIRCYFSVHIDGGARVTGKHGIVVRGVDPDTGLGNNANYNNHFVDCDIRQCDIGIYLYGQDVTNARANSNLIQSGRIGACNKNIVINGQANTIISVTLNPPQSGRSLEITGDQAFNNMVINSYFDASDDPEMVYIDTASSRVPLTIMESVGINSDNITNVSSSPNNVISIINGSTVLASKTITAGSYSIAGDRSDGSFLLKGSKGVSGGVLLGSSDRTDSINALSARGGASVSIQDHADAEFRIVKTSDDTAFTKVLVIDNSGNLSLPLTPTQTTVGSAGVASSLPATPSGYLRVEIGGVGRVIPYYND